MYRSLPLVLIVAILVAAAVPATAATCCCTGKTVPAPFVDACCGDAPSTCCVQRAPAPVAAADELRGALPVQPAAHVAWVDRAADRSGRLWPLTPGIRLTAPPWLEPPSLARLSVLRV